MKLRLLRDGAVYFTRVGGRRWNLGTDLEAAQKAIQLVEEEGRSPERMHPASVYLVAAGPYLKLGVAMDVERRIKGLQTGSPLVIYLLDSTPFVDRGQAERAERVMLGLTRQWITPGGAEWRHAEAEMHLRGMLRLFREREHEDAMEVLRAASLAETGKILKPLGFS